MKSARKIRKLDNAPVVKVYSAKTGKFKRFENRYGQPVVTGTEHHEPKTQRARKLADGTLTLEVA